VDGAALAVCGDRCILLTQKINPIARTIAVIAISHRLIRRVRLMRTSMFSVLLIDSGWLLVGQRNDHRLAPPIDNYQLTTIN
jgi:hypothetical protein